MVRRNPEDAERTLRAYFASSLDEAARTDEPLAFDEIAAYVDGQLDDVDREIFESRLEMNPALRAEVDDLMAMRAAMAAQPAPVRRRASSSSMVWALGALAAAASLTVAVVWVARTRQQQASAVNEQTTATSSTPAPLKFSLQDASGPIGVDPAGTLTVPNLPESEKQDAISALQTGRLPATALPQDLRRAGPLTLMGGDSHPATTTGSAGFGVIAPVATLVREARPVVQWQPLSRARGYKVAIYTDRLERVAASGELTDTTWTPDVDLKPDTTYQWQVTALTPNGPTLTPAPPQPEARFRLIAADRRQALDRQLSEAGSSNLLRGLAFTRAGLLDEADAAFVALAAVNPNSPIARDLLANVRTLRARE
jgi:hypothetical protein